MIKFGLIFILTIGVTIIKADESLADDESLIREVLENAGPALETYSSTVSEWQSIPYGFFNFDLEAHPLQIKTDSVLGSGDVIALYMYDSERSGTYIQVLFNDLPVYSMAFCTYGYNPFPVDVPVEQDTIWTITKSATALIIECNGVEVLQYDYADAPRSSCTEYWAGNDIDKLILGGAGGDTASDAYREKPEDDSASNETVVEVFPEFHLLNPDGRDNGTGLLLAIVGDSIGLLCDRIDLERMCRDKQYDGIDWVSWAGNHFNTSEYREFKPVVTSVYEHDNQTHYYYNATEARYCSADELYVSCKGNVEPTEPPSPVKEVYFELLSFDPYGDLTTDQPEGMVFAVIVTDEDWDSMEVGTVCDDNVNAAAADVICKSKGYSRALEYGDNWEYAYMPENVTVNVTTIMDELHCADGADNIEECEYDLYLHDCSPQENLIVFCDNGNDTDEEYQLLDADLWRWSDGTVIESNEGLAVIVLQNTRTEEVHYGTVCDDGFNDQSANVACRLLGFDYAISWGNHGDYQYISQEIVEEYLEIVVDEFNCPADADSVDDCSYNLMTHDCSHSEDIVLHCTLTGGWTTVESNVYIEYDLEAHPLQIKTDSALGSGDVAHIYLYTADDDYVSWIKLHFTDIPTFEISVCTSHRTTFPVELPAAQDKIWTITKTARALKIECNDVEVLNLVYSEADEADYCVEGYSKDVGIIEFDGMDTASDEYRPRSGSPSPAPPTSSPAPPTSYPLDDEVAVKFGGLQMKLKVNPKKGRAKVVDILEEINYYFLG